MLNKIAISEFWSSDFGKKISLGGGLGALQLFGHLKRALELFISVRTKPSRNIPGPLGRYDHPWEKNEQANKWTRIRDLSSGKKYKIPHFWR